MEPETGNRTTDLFLYERTISLFQSTSSDVYLAWSILEVVEDWIRRWVLECQMSLYELQSFLLRWMKEIVLSLLSWLECRLWPARSGPAGHEEHMVRVARDFVRVEWRHWTSEVVLDAGVSTCPGCFEASCPGPVEAMLEHTASLRQELSVSFLVGFKKGSLTRPAEACRAQSGRKGVSLGAAV